MSAQATVMKFGGTSLEDSPAFQRVAQIVDSSLDAKQPVIVVSAMSAVTDALIRSFQMASHGQSSAALENLETHFERHLNVAGSMGEGAYQTMRTVITQSRKEIVELLDGVQNDPTAEVQDAVVSYGERLSAKLLTIVLERLGIPASYVDARECILTDAEHGCAAPLIPETIRSTQRLLKPLIEAGTIPVLAGFIGSSPTSATTTLGRGSSNYTATLVSAAIGARETQIWTDVDGVKTADPSLVPEAQTVLQLSYEEASELARLGANVLHPKMFEPLTDQNIPVRIRNSRSPEESGTLICSEAEPSVVPIKAIATKTSVTTIDVTSTPAFVANGFLGAIREIFKRHRTDFNLLAKSDFGISCASEADGRLPAIVEDLRLVGDVSTAQRRAVISCVGAGLDGSKEQAETVQRLLTNIEPAVNWRSTSRINLIGVVNEADVVQSVRKLHEGIFKTT